MNKYHVTFELGGEVHAIKDIRAENEPAAREYACKRMQQIMQRQTNDPGYVVMDSDITAVEKLS